MKLIFKGVIPVEPRTKKNSQNIFMNKKTGRAFISTSAAYKAYDAEAGKYLDGRMKTPVNVPVEVTARFYMKTRRRVDLTNLMEALHDILVKHKVLADDNSQVIVSVDGSRVLYDKDNPRTEFEIKEMIE